METRIEREDNGKKGRFVIYENDTINNLPAGRQVKNQKSLISNH